MIDILGRNGFDPVTRAWYKPDRSWYKHLFKVMSMFDNIRQDLRSYNGNWAAQGFWAMVTYRFGRWRYTLRFPPFRMFCSLLYKILYKYTQMVTGIELPCEATVGKNFRIDHFGDIIISGYAVFGDDCVIRNGVTVGLRHESNPAAPKIGNNVSIGAGAKILGPITIGDNVDIGANAVVIDNVPSNSIAVGVPAKILPKKDHD